MQNNNRHKVTDSKTLNNYRSHNGSNNQQRINNNRSTVSERTVAKATWGFKCILPVLKEIRKSNQEYFDKLDNLLSSENNDPKLIWKLSKQVLNLKNRLMLFQLSKWIKSLPKVINKKSKCSIFISLPRLRSMISTKIYFIWTSPIYSRIYYFL